MTNRNAVDVLLDLESKIDSLLNLIKTQDLQLKLLSNKISLILEKQPIVLQEKAQSPRYTISDGDLDFKVTPQTSSPIMVQAGVEVQLNNQPQENQRARRPDIQFEELQSLEEKDEFFDVTSEQLMEQKASIDRKGSIPVSQKIVTSGGKSVYLASIEVFDVNNNSLIKTKTNISGKWSTSLKPGEYTVLLKRAPGQHIKDPIKIKYPIEVKSTFSGVFELKDFILNN